MRLLGNEVSTRQPKVIDATRIAPEVKEALETLQRLNADPPSIEDTGVEPANLAEGLALIIAIVRNANEDEAVWAEAALRYIQPEREHLIEARRVLSALGYREISAVLARLIRSAPRVPGWLKANRKAKAEWRARILASVRARRAS